MAKEKIELVLATATKINQSDRLIVVIDPQYADYQEMLRDELHRITGHGDHTILPIPKDLVKFYRIESDIMINETSITQQEPSL